jgi:hypothetical protein
MFANRKALILTLACVLPIYISSCKLLGGSDGAASDPAANTGSQDSGNSWGTSTYLNLGFDAADFNDTGGNTGAGFDVAASSIYNHASSYWGGSDRAIFTLNKYCGLGTDATGNHWLYPQGGVVFNNGSWNSCTPSGAYLCEMYMDFSQHLSGAYDPSNYTLEIKFALDSNNLFELGFDMHFSAGKQIRLIPSGTNFKIFNGAFETLATANLTHSMSRDTPITVRIKVVDRNTISVYESVNNDGNFTPLVADLDISASTASFTRQPGLFRLRMDQSCAGSLKAARVDYIKLISNN